MSNLEPLIEKTTKVDDELLLGDSSIQKARVQFIERTYAERQQRNSGLFRSALVVPVAAGAAIAAAAIISLYIFRAGEPNKSAAAVGEWIRTTADQEKPIDFEDGSKVVFAPGTEGRIVKSHGAQKIVLLERGEATFHVIHRFDTDWRVNAGPFEVRVTGTSFKTAWRPDDTHLVVEVYEGEVVVQGPLVAEGQKIGANHVFSAMLEENRVEISLVRAQETATEPLLTESSDSTSAGGKASEEEFDDQEETAKGAEATRKQKEKAASKTPVQPGSLEGEPGSVLNWEEEARQGNFETAIEIVGKQDLSKLLAAARPEELFLLGDSARLTGHYDVAERAYITVRSRFGDTGHATAAALALGRMAFDQLADYRNASAWLEIYLNEERGSSLSREILGRLMEAQLKSGSDEQARITAGKYLMLYPQGPHAKLAMELLDQK